jgi:mannose/fructose/N-acetylgalactosamine-specific phosphotransferase system component IID
MQIEWSRVIPVIVSIIIIILVAILRQYSKMFAAIAATMPINIPLGMWIIYAGDDKQTALADFSEAVMINILPTLAFIVTAWLMAKAGHALLPTILVGYLVWGVCLGAVLIIRAQLGR